MPNPSDLTEWAAGVIERDRLHRGDDRSAEAESDWRAESAADEYQASGGSYREGLARLRRECPWLFDHSIPEPNDARPGQDPAIVLGEVDHPTRVREDFSWPAA